VLFTRSDVWRVADEKVDGKTQSTQAYYVELSLPDAAQEPGKQPGTRKPSFVLLQTFSPAASKGGGGTANNMTSWLAAECDYTKTNHPRLVSVPLNNQNNVLGPLQFDNNLNSDPDISRLLSLLGQGGSSVHLGNVIVLPFADHSFLYVRPLYVLASSGGSSAFPLLRYVAVGTQNNVALGTSLRDALQKLFSTSEPIPGLEPGAGTTAPVESAPSTFKPGGSAPPTSAPPALSAEVRQIVDDLLTHQTAAESAFAKGDFAAYGREEAAIKSDTDKLRAALKGSGSPSATASPSGGAPSPSSH